MVVQINLRGESIMKKRTLRLFATAMVLSLAASLFAGCGSGNKQGGSDQSQAGGAAESTASAGGSGAGSASASGKDTLIIVTANETPSVTTNLHNAVAGDYLNKMTHNSLFYMDETNMII